MLNKALDVVELYISPEGNNDWSGILKTPNKVKDDGPLASIEGALEKINELQRRPRKPCMHFKHAGITGPVIVWLRGGTYHISKPIVIQANTLPVTFAAYPGEKPIIDGGVELKEWKIEKLNGKAVWTTQIPDVAEGEWYFRQLFVNGERRNRPRFPKKSLYRMKEAPEKNASTGWTSGGHTKFICSKGNVKNYKNLNDIEVVYVHFWIEERSPIESFDAKLNLVTMARESRTSLVAAHGTELADYYLDNVQEALSDPGEWYLNRKAGKLTYIPLKGETLKNTEITAPQLLQLLRITGNPDGNKYVENIKFKGITFQNTDWCHPGEDEESSLDLLTYKSASSFNRGNHAASAQAAADVPGVITFKGANNCAIEDCEIRNVGWYGIYLAEGCRENRLVGNQLYDLGAGGIKINGAGAHEPEHGRTCWNRITDNHIHKAGRIFHSGVGILSMHSANNLIAHNHIHDLFYSGISCGWVWGYTESSSYCNIIEQNHIHNIGQGLLSDMGGIYLLGPQSGTMVRNNLIHDVEKMHYGGWALYTDEGSSNIVMENNICYNTNGEIFHQHYGCENVIRNNIFVSGDEAMLAYTRIEPHTGITFMRNIIVSKGSPIFNNDNYNDNGRRILSDLNLFWDTTKKEPVFISKDKKISFKEWQKQSHDVNSIIADPEFADLAKNNFKLAENSPAFQLGFKPIDMSDVGVRESVIL
jgi:parallel beta-helix repeat protein